MENGLMTSLFWFPNDASRKLVVLKETKVTGGAGTGVTAEESPALPTIHTTWLLQNHPTFLLLRLRGSENVIAHRAEMGKVVFWKFWLLCIIIVVKLAKAESGKTLYINALFVMLNLLHIAPMQSYYLVTFTT